MQFYAYKPNENGCQPLGTGDKLIFKLGTMRGAVKRCEKYFGGNYRLYTYSDLYDYNTFKLVHEGSEVTPPGLYL